MGKRDFWTEEKRKLLFELYETIPTKAELMLHFEGIKPHALNEYARRNGLKRPDISKYRTRGTLEPLLADTPEVYYWIGMICADGWISKTGQLVLWLHEKDQLHLEKLAKLLKTTIKYIQTTGGYTPSADMVRIAIQHKGVGLAIAKKFNIEFQKTYNPPATKILKRMSDDLFISWFAGMCDGDGSIYKRISKVKNSITYSIKLENHASWIDIHRYIAHRIYKIYGYKPTIHFSKRGYSNFTLHKTEVVKNILKRIKELNLPVLERKWDKIEL